MFRVVRQEQPFGFRPHIQSGACGLFFQFSGVLSPAPEVEAVETVIDPGAPRGAIVREYVPPMQEAIRAKAEQLSEYTGILCSLRVTVSEMREHPVDTSERAVRQRSAMFVGDLCVGWLTEALPSLPPEQRNAAVLGLARQIRDESAFDLLPVLADALEDAGCSDGLILAHCRGCPDHAPRCWAADWVLWDGK